MSRLPLPAVRASRLLSGYLPISAQPFGLVLPIGLKFKLCERGFVWLASHHPDTVTTLGGVLASASLIGYWTSRVPLPLGQVQFSVQCAITKEAGLWLTSSQPTYRALSAEACTGRGCGSAWQSQLTLLQNNVLVCCLPSWVWLCQLFNFATNNVRQNVITIIKLLAPFESYFTYVKKIKSNLNTSTRRK